MQNTMQSRAYTGSCIVWTWNKLGD